MVWECGMLLEKIGKSIRSRPRREWEEGQILEGFVV